tara:strand:- start:563 stop:1822 length:1260 start_codon:yes stop_codon:yes gene_type:complete
MGNNAPIFSTLGCRLNYYETEAMRKIIDGVNLKDTVIINTCAVTSEAVRKARQEIRKLRRSNPEAKLIVTGCAAQIEPHTFSKMSEVDLVLGNTAKLNPEPWLSLSKKGSFKTEDVIIDDIMAVKQTSRHLIDGFGTRSRAYVQIQNGCDHRCTFCIIPFGRGNSRSSPAGVIVDQIKRLVGNGYKEIVLTGVDLTSWGQDLPATPKLGNLVLRILKLVPDLERLRLSSIDSIEADEFLMLALANEKRLMPHLHLSLQSGDNIVLKRMKRRHLREDAINFCETVRKLRPEVTFGADIIAGFPTETDEMFENSLRLIDECGLTWLHVFPFSSRTGTPASRMPQTDGKIIKKRASVLRDLGKIQVAKHLKSEIGKRHNILIETSRVGRTEQFTEVLFNTDQIPGDIVNKKILGSVDTKLFV